MREHDPAKNAERLRKLNEEAGDLQRSHKDFQKSTNPIQQPGACRACGRPGCDGKH